MSLFWFFLCCCFVFFFFQAEDGIRDAQESRGLGDVYKRQMFTGSIAAPFILVTSPRCFISGKCFSVTFIGNGSISLAHFVTIPKSLADKGNPAMPSKRDPNVNSILYLPSSDHPSHSLKNLGFIECVLLVW